MSKIYTKFRKEVSKSYAALEKTHPIYTHEQLNTLAEKTIFEAWIEQQKFDDLIEYILENWDAGHGDLQILSLSNALKVIGDQKRMRVFWRKVIKSRTEWYKLRRKQKISSLTKKFHELQKQWAGSLEKRYGNLATHFWLYDGVEHPRSSLIWALHH